MSTFSSLLGRFSYETGQEGRTDGGPFKLTSTLSRPATDDEISVASADLVVPAEVAAAWKVSANSRLYVDEEYGQWGLVLLSPAESAARTIQERRERPDAWDDSDVVFGEFLGDQELLAIDQVGAVLIALPLDGRSDWYRAADNLAGFLGQYLNAGGNKFWESVR